VKALDYAPWTEPHLIIDTAMVSPIEAVAIIEARIDALSGERLPPR
jgi:cytidylate kinase